MKRFLLTLTAVLLIAGNTLAQSNDSYEGTVVSDEGAWCWLPIRARYFIKV